MGQNRKARLFVLVGENLRVFLGHENSQKLLWVCLAQAEVQFQNARHRKTQPSKNVSSIVKSEIRFVNKNGSSDWIVITGATSGIGLELAKLGMGLGHNLLLISRDLEKLTNVRRDL